MDLKKAFELTERKLRYIIDDEYEKIWRDPELKDLYAKCAFCTRCIERQVFCEDCEVKNICLGAYRAENYEEALKQLLELKKKLGVK